MMAPRRSLRSSASLSAPTTPAKRDGPMPSGSARTNKSQPTARQSRASKMNTKNKSTSRKQPDNDSEDDEEIPSSPSAASAEASGYEDEDASVSEPDSLEEVSDFDSEDEAPPSKKRRTSNKSPASSKKTPLVTPPKSAKGQELWRPGVSAGLGPGKEVVIEKPKPRPEGKTKYKDNTIHPNTMLFLKELKANNDREWLKMHDPDYRTSWKDFISFLEAVQEKLIEVDEEIPELPTKDIVFRIYRDVRFSKDQTPYKTWFSAAWSRTGRKGPYACYYLQVAPGSSYVGGGLWMPEAPALAKLRRDIDRKPHKLKQVLAEPGFRKEFLKGVKDDEKMVIKAFTEHNSRNALKTKPKGYDADHRDIELLKLRNFTIGRKIQDEEIVGSNGLEKVTESFSRLREFVHYINSVVMPDDDDDDDEDGSPSSGGEDEDEDEDDNDD